MIEEAIFGDVVCKSKKNGNLGVKELEMFNDSLLSKWRWGLLQDKESMWSRFLSFKYGNVHTLPLKLQKRSTSTFCFIIMIWDAKMKFLVSCVAVKYKIHLCEWTIKLFFKNIRAMWLSI